MSTFLKGAGVIALLLLGSALLAAASPQIGLYVSIALLVLPLIALFKPIPSLRLGHRGFSLAVLLIVGLPGTIATVSIIGDKREEQFAALKATDTTAYLEALKTFDQKRWLEELKAIDPEQHTVELARIAEEEAREAEEKRKAAEAETAEMIAKECGEKNASLAYVMSQDFVKQQLRAPATADFPSWPDEYRVSVLGNCQYQVQSYVDAQNGFGALIRSNYSAVVQLFPESGSWVALEVNIQS
jgi:hypothetical protein